MKGLRGSALEGARWSFLGNIAVQGLSVLTLAILARLLTPDDFGLVAVATVAAGMLAWASEIGLGAVVVRHGDHDRTLLDSMFWISIALAAALALGGAAASAPLALLLRAENAALLIFAATCVAGVKVVAGVPRGLLAFRLQFGAVAAIRTVSYLASSAVAIALAYFTSLGPWSIIFGRLVDGVLEGMLGALAARFRPRFRFRWQRVRRELRFGAGFLANRFAGQLAKNLDYWFVSRVAGPGALGLYYMAYVVPNLVRQRMTWAIEAALFPVLSQIQGDRERLASAYCSSLQGIAMVAYPVLIGVAVTAQSIVIIVFGAAWLDAAAPLQWLALAAAVDALVTPSRSVHLALGVPIRTAGFVLLNIALLAPALLVASTVGTLRAFALAVLVSTLLTTCANLVVTCRFLGISFRKVVSALAPALVATSFMFAVVVGAMWRVPRIADLHPVAQLGVIGSLGATAYVACGFLVFPKDFAKLARDVVVLLGIRGAASG